MDDKVIGNAFVNFRGGTESIELVSEEAVASSRYEEIGFDEAGEICIFFDTKLSEYVGVRFRTKE